MRRLLTASAAVATLVLGSASAVGATSSDASCLGVGSSANAGYPRDRAVISHDVKDFANVFGITPGSLISGSAHEHLGSPQACFGE